MQTFSRNIYCARSTCFAGRAVAVDNLRQVPSADPTPIAAPENAVDLVTRCNHCCAGVSGVLVYRGSAYFAQPRPEPLDFNAFKLQGDPALIIRFVAAGNAVVGALLPGVDSDFAGLYLRDAQALQRFLDVDLAQECARAGIQLQLQSAADFALGARLAS